MNTQTWLLSTKDSINICVINKITDDLPVIRGKLINAIHNHTGGVDIQTNTTDFNKDIFVRISNMKKELFKINGVYIRVERLTAY